MQYVSFARRQKSNKKAAEILTQMLRLFPTESEIWIYAARYALEEKGDMSEARTYMQKGLRLCESSEEMWVEYAKMELIQIAKLDARNKILGLDENGKHRNQSIRSDEDMHDGTLDELKITAKDNEGYPTKKDEPDGGALGSSQIGPSKMGAVPIAIFDAALEGSTNRSHIAWAFFDMVAEVDVPPRGAILNHILECMQSIEPGRVETLIRSVKQPVIGVDPRSLEFPMSVAVSLDRYHAATCKLDNMPCHRRFHEDIEAWIRELLVVEGLDDDICTVLRALLKKTKSKIK